VIGGAIVESFSWQWVFWINVPIGLALLPIAWFRLQETTGPNRSLTSPGSCSPRRAVRHRVGLVRSDGRGWTSLVSPDP